MGDVANITTGPSTLYVAAVSVGVPSLTGKAGDFNNFSEIGFTQDGIEWDYTPTWKDLMVDELMSPAKKKIVAHKLVVSAKLAETTLQNLAYACAGATLVGTDTITIGSVDDAPEFRLGWIGPAPQNKLREAVVYKVQSIAAVKAHIQRKDMTIYQVQFEALSDPTQATTADLCTMQDF
jgi:hypothetical protein